ncbi:DUF6279 family lipoprotein [Catenovulum sediminis]|uniref:DUF6279 family lipoprotein n=1 Tax=Catenovulum sediminis TaxID=1740262 RepID=A0ABV1RIB7_9ALTE|nr:DUF6279 family lipoprotein [Catenovulum sediminis]
MKKKWVVLLFCLPLVTGCSLTFLYNNADWVASWYLDDYVDLTHEQSEIFEEKFDSWHQWHRTEQLPLYKTQVDALLAQIEMGIKPDVFKQHIDQVETHWRNLLFKITPELSEMLLMLSDRQKRELIDNLREKNTERREEWLAMDGTERYEQAWERRVEQNENWFGTLNKKQLKVLKMQGSEYENTFLMWLDYRDNWINAFENALFVKEKNIQREGLQKVLATPYLWRGDALQQALDVNRQKYSEHFVEMLDLLTTKQHKFFVAKLTDYQQDFLALHQKYD